MPTKKRSNKIILEELEPRILFSADPLGVPGVSLITGMSSEKHQSLSDADLVSLGLIGEQPAANPLAETTAQPIKQRVDQTVTETLLATKDTYITDFNHSANYGQAGEIQIDISGGEDLGKERILLQFDLSSLPANATITSAELRMNASVHTGGNTVTINVHTLNELWDEGLQTSGNGEANWDRRQTGVNWGSAGGVYDATAVASKDVIGAGVHSWDLTTTVQDWASGAVQNRGVIIGSPQPGSDVFRYLSAEGSPTSGPRLEVSYTTPNAPPVATGLSAGETYIEDVALNLADITISDADDTTTTASLTLSQPAAGSLSTASSGSVTSTYDAGTGVWEASGTIADVNTLLSAVIFTPSTDYDGDFTIATKVSDGIAPSITGLKNVTATPVNDAPTAVNLGVFESYTEDTSLNLTDIVVADVDNTTISVGLTLSDPLAGSLTTATSGSVTSTYDSLTGTWVALGNIADVNSLLADLTFMPDLNYNSDFSIVSSVSDLDAPPILGFKALTGTAVNDAPTAVNLNIVDFYAEDTPLNLADLTVTDVDSTTISVVLTLSDPAAGSLTTATSGSVTSSYDSPSGVWQAAGDIADVNSLLADLTFVPALNYNNGFSFSSSITDNVAPPLTGFYIFFPTPVNDAPIITNLGGDVTVALNDTTLYQLDSNASATLVDVDSPANYAGAYLDVSGRTFDINDVLTIDTGAGVSLSSGIADGSILSIGGLDVASLSGTSNSTLRITFNAASTSAHVEDALRSLAFFTDSNVLGARSIDVVFNDGNGTANGGADTSAAQTVTVYVAQAGGQQVNALEDTLYAFSVTDFDFTGITGSNLESITILSLPADSGTNKGTLLYGGAPATIGQVVTRADILNGELEFLSDSDDSGTPYVSFDFQVNNGKLNVSILSGQADNNALFGSGWTETNALLSSATNFGLGGVYPTRFSLIANSETIDADYLAQGQIFVDGSASDTQWSAAELGSLRTWVENGGVLIATADRGAKDAVVTEFGLTLGGQTTPNWQISDTSNAIINGQFGSVGNLGDPIVTAGGYYAFFDPLSLAAGDEVIATGSGGSSQPTIVLRQQGNGWILFTGDEGIFRGDMSGGGAISTQNDILIANIFAWAADRLPATDSHEMTISVAAVNDPPEMRNYSLSIMEGEALVLESSDLRATDADNLDSSLVFNVSAVEGGQFEFVSNPGVAINSFSQAEIGASNVQVVHDGEESPLSFDVAASDGLASSATRSASINYTPVNDPPVVVGISGGATVAVNDGTAAVIGGGALAAINDADVPSNYAGAVLHIRGSDFAVNDSLGLDTAGTISLSSGLESGSQISIAGVVVGSVGVSSASELEINFNSNSNASHVDRLLNSVTFATTSEDFNRRTVSVAFNDGGGSVNGGDESSAAVSTFVYLRSSGTGIVVGDEDLPYAFKTSDFDFTGVTDAGLQYIRVLNTPVAGLLSLSGVAVVDGQRIDRADIEAGNLQYMPEPNANGIPLAGLTVQINNGILSTNILAGKPSDYTLGASEFANAEAIILSDDNFGFDSVYPTDISLLSSSSVINQFYLQQGDVFFDGDTFDVQWTNDEIKALDTWVSAGGVLISTTDSTASNTLSEYYGLSVGGSSSSTWLIDNAASAIMSGPFGNVGANGSPISATGLQHIYFSSASLNPDDQVLAVDSNTGEPTIVMRAHGDGWLLFTGDEGVFRADTTGGGVINTANDRLVANTFAWAISQLPAQSTHDVSIAINPVNDAPLASGLDVAQSYEEDRALTLASIEIADVDNTVATVTLTLSAPEAGILSTNTVGSVSSSYDTVNGVWSARGDIASLNTLLADLQFVPTDNFNADFTIATEVSDGIATALSGLKSIIGLASNDGPRGDVAIDNMSPIEQDTLTVINTLTDIDGMPATVNYQWLRDGDIVVGAQEAIYTVTADDIGAVISVQVSYTDDDGTIEVIDSPVTDTVIRKNDPATLSLSQSSISLLEYPVSSERVRLADIEFSDDGVGDNIVTLAGADADLFEIDDGVLYLKANVQLDYETATRLEVTVEIDDGEVPGAPDDAKTFEVLVEDFNELSLVSREADAASAITDTVSQSAQASPADEAPAPDVEPAFAESSNVESNADTELANDNVETESQSPIASTISENLARGQSAGATRQFDANGVAGQQDQGVVITGVNATSQLSFTGFAQGNEQQSPQTVDLGLLLELDASVAFVEPLSTLDEFVTVDPMEGFALLDNSTFQSGLDDMRRQVLGNELQDQLVVGSTVTVTTGVSVAYVLWMIRGSVLLSTVLSSLPAWRLIDPLPVISGMLQEQDEDSESLESIIEDSETEPEELEANDIKPVD